MWIYRTGKVYKDTPIVLYEYQRTRKADQPREFLKGFTGVRSANWIISLLF
jgi:hypothetical protein